MVECPLLAQRYTIAVYAYGTLDFLSRIVSYSRIFLHYCYKRGSRVEGLVLPVLSSVRSARGNVGDGAEGGL